MTRSVGISNTTKKTAPLTHKVSAASRRNKEKHERSRPLTAYTAFFKAEKNRWLAANQNQGTTPRSSRLINMTKHIVTRWKSLTDEERKVYQDIAAQDKKCFLQERELVRAKQRAYHVQHQRQQQAANPSKDDLVVQPPAVVARSQSSPETSLFSAATLAASGAMLNNSAAQRLLAMSQQGQQGYQQPPNASTFLTPNGLLMEHIAKLSSGSQRVPTVVNGEGKAIGFQSGVAGALFSSQHHQQVPISRTSNLTSMQQQLMAQLQGSSLTLQETQASAYQQSFSNVQRSHSISLPLPTTVARSNTTPATVLQEQLLALEKVRLADSGGNSVDSMSGRLGSSLLHEKLAQMERLEISKEELLKVLQRTLK